MKWFDRALLIITVLFTLIFMGATIAQMKHQDAINASMSKVIIQHETTIDSLRKDIDKLNKIVLKSNKQIKDTTNEN